MPESPLRTLSVNFAVQILNLVKILKSRHETIVSNQIGRAGTSCSTQSPHGGPPGGGIGPDPASGGWQWIVVCCT